MPNAYLLGGQTRRDDLETQLQVLAAYVTDPGWRPEAFRPPAELRADHGGAAGLHRQRTVLQRDIQGLLHRGDGRWTFPTASQIGGETEDLLKSEMTPSLGSGPIEVTVVGDVTVDKAIDAVANTFGALPKRPDPPAPGGRAGAATP